MKYPSMLALAVFAATALVGQNVTPTKTPLKIGDIAPDFTISANNTSTRSGAIKLSDFRGKKNVILAFFPAAFTGG